MPANRTATVVASFTALAASTAAAQGPTNIALPPPSSVVPGELVVDPPTLINLGFEWLVQGDDNRNSSVAVTYRKAGESSWRDALPLLRLQGERIYAESRVDVVAPNMFAGSVLDLSPDTRYEVRFVMSDPDGVAGNDGACEGSGGRGPVPSEAPRGARDAGAGGEGAEGDGIEHVRVAAGDPGGAVKAAEHRRQRRDVWRLAEQPRVSCDAAHGEGV